MRPRKVNLGKLQTAARSLDGSWIQGSVECRRHRRPGRMRLLPQMSQGVDFRNQGREERRRPAEACMDP